MSRPALRLAALFLGALVQLAAPTGCGPRGLQRIEVPKAGVKMRYALEPGATFSGRLRVGNTRTIEGAGNVSQSLDCEVQLVVVDAGTERGGALVRATFSNIELDWGLPPSAPMSPEEFTRSAITRLQGMNVAFRVRPNGEIVDMPSPPQELPDIDKQFIDTVLDALEQAFFVMPDRAVKDDESWTEDEKRGREGKLGRYLEGKVQTRVDGMFRDDSRKEDLVRLVVSRKRNETITTKDGSRKNESEAKLTAMFATAGYLAELEGETRDFDPVEGMTFSKVKVVWKKVSGGAAGGGPAAGTTTEGCVPDGNGGETCPEQQEITDPCHADYVGAEVCPTEDGAAPEPAADAAADAKPETTADPKPTPKPTPKPAPKAEPKPQP